MRQGKPWIIDSIQCRRHEHLLCLHGTEQEGKGTRYTILCTCKCHYSQSPMLSVVPKATRRSIVRKETESCSPVQTALSTSHRIKTACARTSSASTYGAPPGSFALALAVNSGNESRPPTPTKPERANPGAAVKQQLAPAPASATSSACNRDRDLAIDSAMDPKQQLARALKCDSCGEKRTVVRWEHQGYFGGGPPDFKLCGACLIGALKLLLWPNLIRKKGGPKK